MGYSFILTDRLEIVQLNHAHMVNPLPLERALYIHLRIKRRFAA
jgi:hypothetical protein